MYSLNCLIDSNRISKNTPILFTTTAALGLFFIGVLILSLTGLGVISTTGYIIGTVALLLGFTGLAVLFCSLLKKKKLSTPPPKPSSQTPEIRTPSPQKTSPPETIKPRKFDTPPYSVDLTKIQKPLEVSIKEPRELDLEYQKPFFYLFEKLEERISDYLNRNLISPEKIFREEFEHWRGTAARILRLFKIAIETAKINPSKKDVRIFAFYLLELSKKMEEGIFSEEVCIEICKNLLRAVLHCTSAWVEVSERLYYRYCLGVLDLERSLRINLNEIKKNMCEACLCTGRETQSDLRDILHLYNGLANSDFGKTWGLSSLGTTADRSGWSVSNATIQELSTRFEELINPEFLIDLMLSQINQTSYNIVYYNALVSSIRPEELQPNQTSSDFVANRFYSEDYILNKEGVTRLLLNSGWLRFSRPH